MIGRSRARTVRTVVVASVLVGVAAGFFVTAATRVPGQAEPPPAHVDTALPGTVAAAAPLDRSAPVRLEIPRIGLDTSPGRSGTTTSGALAAPADFAHTTWFEPGASPGEAGPAVILGHVDSTSGPAVFFRLGELAAGDEVLVTRADGRTAHFVVDRTESVDKTEFPTDRVFADDGTARLRLITCGGTFDPDRGRYLANVIVYATLVATT
ncbi:class F sortase [Nocardia asteroides]|uniref:Peptidase C60 family protein n=1 Tax=Nocardia asteroides NBRC 15531 TaxID=1110697 RepID=U5EGF1_NOCAS|nr:class F sortase [Nocardia asteroides]UGT50666.1 class F sortase [Nocardia asteroides]GAD84224.1 peptidase C60 family protein [Nocardia asteroides NBRC 15531]SFN31387.1 LPXTG-site transpeptidase (sortase) family protein [Nocardia asteroides]VEG36508.1 Sortase (surface protein transpeptidase) [Nocardia asteroides]